MTTSLASLIADVILLTNRPDLVGETTLAVRAATLKAHHSDFYAKDLFETGVQFDFTLAQQVLEYKTLIPRWRALKYIRKFDYSTPPGVAGLFLKVMTTDEVMDSYGVTRENVCYVAGSQIQIRCLAASKYFLVGCYLHPDVTEAGYNSWIADEYPMVIVYEAAASIFKTIGADEQNAAYQRLLGEEYQLLRMNNLLANGY